jgi:hypothetical protein
MHKTRQFLLGRREKNGRVGDDWVHSAFGFFEFLQCLEMIITTYLRIAFILKVAYFLSFVAAYSTRKNKACY